MNKAKISISVVALRVTIELFRILSGETSKISINTLIGYANRVELMPLSFPQMLHALGIMTPDNFAERNLKNL